MCCRQGQHADGTGRTRHINGSAQWNRHRVGGIVQTQTLSQIHVHRNVGGRRTGKEGRYTAFAQALKHQWERIAAYFPPHNQWIHHKSHHQHGTQQYHEQAHIAEQGFQACAGHSRGHQAENAQRCKTYHPFDDPRHAIRQIIDHLTRGVAGMAQRNAQTNRPSQNADKVGIGDGFDWVVYHAQHQGFQDLTDIGRGRRSRFSRLCQYQLRWKQHAGNHSHHRCTKRTHQIQDDDGLDVIRLIAVVIGNCRRYQDEHQHRCHRFERGNEDLAQNFNVASHRWPQ